MLKRIFTKNAPEDQREYYRRVPGKGATLGVKVICANGAPIPGTLMDLSAGGAAIEFKEDLSQELFEGEQRELVFSSLTLSSIRAWAQVRTVPTERNPSRYGFQFLDAAALFEQLDDA
ncbi:MAG: PilZ domain-containing protein, partial [Planctomycetota bacterium]